MNKQAYDILKLLMEKPYSSQRVLAAASGYSLGIVNRSIKILCQKEYLDEDMQPTMKARLEMAYKSPKNAVILAAGYGMRMVPINVEMPKGLLEVKGEVLIERIIKQLHEVNIREIYVVVGFMKEKYEYLIDRFHVKLVVNSEYAIKNNIHSVKKVCAQLSNTYIVPCDIWCRQNPFSRCEFYSWYMVSDLPSPNSNIRVNRKLELVAVDVETDGASMIGITYLLEKEAAVVKERITQFSRNRKYDSAFWEEALYEHNRMMVWARQVHFSDVSEINTYEQLRELDCDSQQLKSGAITMITDVLGVKPFEITDITTLKKGMTNRSFLFTCHGKKYIMRIPGEGTEQLINRKQEAAVYQIIGNKGISDRNIYINPENGYKITEFMENSRVCNPENRSDVIKCVEKMRDFHEMKLTVSHHFELFEQIVLYESLWQNEASIYKDYVVTKQNIFSLKNYIDCHIEQKALTHIDAVPDNFLFVMDKQGDENLFLIDWEYAGMQDPHVDIAMFCIYSFYEQKQIDDVIQIYFQGNCPEETKIKIYCYIAVCGLLWSNWCEYKRILGVDFGEYSLRQYRYAKEYYQIVRNMLGEEKAQWGIR